MRLCPPYACYFYTSYRKWFCQENDIVVIVQVTRQCYVT
jgi:hypothetical protein